MKISLAIPAFVCLAFSISCPLTATKENPEYDDSLADFVALMKPAVKQRMFTLVLKYVRENFPNQAYRLHQEILGWEQRNSKYIKMSETFIASLQKSSENTSNHEGARKSANTLSNTVIPDKAKKQADSLVAEIEKWRLNGDAEKFIGAYCGSISSGLFDLQKEDPKAASRIDVMLDRLSNKK